MTGPRNYGRSAPSTFGRKTEKQESRLEYEARIAREERERTEYFKKVAKLMKERTGMKKIKVSEATGPALDWLVAKCLNDDEVIFLGLQPFVWCDPTYSDDMHRELFQPAHRWAQGGPIIEREGIELREGNPLYFPQGNEKGDYHEPLWISGKMRGPTPLIAAMRCFVASKLGDTVGVPEELG